MAKKVSAPKTPHKPMKAVAQKTTGSKPKPPMVKPKESKASYVSVVSPTSGPSTPRSTSVSIPSSDEIYNRLSGMSAGGSEADLFANWPTNIQNGMTGASPRNLKDLENFS